MRCAYPTAVIANRIVDPEPSPSRSTFKSLLADSYSQTLSEQWLKGAWEFVREKVHHHFVVQPLIGEMGQSALLIERRGRPERPLLGDTGQPCP